VPQRRRISCERRRSSNACLTVGAPTHAVPRPHPRYFLLYACFLLSAPQILGEKPATVPAEAGKPAPRLFKRKLAAKGVKVPVGGGAEAATA
jgi:hypothetical protein